MILNQITLPAIDLARSLVFYRTLGLRLIVDALPDYARFETPEGGSTLSLHRVDEVASTTGVVVYFECADLDQRVPALQEQGLIVDSGPRDESWLWREARLCDPDGNVICLFWAGENRRYPPWRVQSADQG